MNLPRCDQFATHLARNLKPLIAELQFKSGVKNAKNVITQFANKLHRLAQESVIAFPRSASTVNNSPRFQEFLRIAVENVVVGSVHELGAISLNCFQTLWYYKQILEMYKDNRRTDKVTKIEQIFSKLDFDMNKLNSIDF